MKMATREWIRRKVPPPVFQLAQSCWWHSRFYIPHLIASCVVRRNPKVQVFPAGRHLGITEQLCSVNVFAPTEMCRTMTKHGSDKGQGWHNYTTVYFALFNELRRRPLQIFELGLGTNNPNHAFSMGSNGRPGASLRGWRELFPQALVYGADIDRGVLFEEDRIKTFYCDQLDKAAIRQLWAQPVLQGGMDLIIDDGLHTFEGNISFLDGSLEQLRPGGIYVVEDIFRQTIQRWYHRLETVYARQFPYHEFAFVELPNSANKDDNNLVIIRRRQ